MSKVEAFLSAEEEQEIVQAILEAEKNTSGEIRVHIEAYKVRQDGKGQRGIPLIENGQYQGRKWGVWSCYIYPDTKLRPN